MDAQVTQLDRRRGSAIRLCRPPSDDTSSWPGLATARRCSARRADVPVCTAISFERRLLVTLRAPPSLRRRPRELVRPVVGDDECPGRHGHEGRSLLNDRPSLAGDQPPGRCLGRRVPGSWSRQRIVPSHEGADFHDHPDRRPGDVARRLRRRHQRQRRRAVRLVLRRRRRGADTASRASRSALPNRALACCGRASATSVP